MSRIDNTENLHANYQKETTKMREFETGATRDGDETKVDFEGFFSPFVFKRFGVYMHKHRKQADGKLRDSDNWQKGIPIRVYMKSWWRHFVNVWEIIRNWPADGEPTNMSLEDLEAASEALCATLFNNMGMLHEIEKERIETKYENQ